MRAVWWSNNSLVKKWFLNVTSKPTRSMQKRFPFLMNNSGKKRLSLERKKWWLTTNMPKFWTKLGKSMNSRDVYSLRKISRCKIKTERLFVSWQNKDLETNGMKQRIDNWNLISINPFKICKKRMQCSIKRSST